MGFFEKLKNGLMKTKTALKSKLDGLFSSYDKINDDFYDELMDILLTADIGVQTSDYITERLRSEVKENHIKSASEARERLIAILADTVGEGEPLVLETKPSVIGKIAMDLKKKGKKVMLAAADTFRAAAIEQLEVWADRVGVPIIKQKEGADPAAVVFDSVAAAKKQGADVLIVDTAGRLHNKKNLVDELAKINRIIERELSGCSKETLLVLDASTGQNALIQAEEFSKAAKITGIVLTKLDGTAKGGIVLSIKKELDIPVKYIGVGEQIDDLQPFDGESFVKAMFEQ